VKILKFWRTDLSYAQNKQRGEKEWIGQEKFEKLFLMVVKQNPG
jgi:hypothetical protein